MCTDSFESGKYDKNGQNVTVYAYPGGFCVRTFYEGRVGMRAISAGFRALGYGLDAHRLRSAKDRLQMMMLFAVQGTGKMKYY